MNFLRFLDSILCLVTILTVHTCLFLVTFIEMLRSYIKNWYGGENATNDTVATFSPVFVSIIFVAILLLLFRLLVLFRCFSCYCLTCVFVENHKWSVQKSTMRVEI